MNSSVLVLALLGASCCTCERTSARGGKDVLAKSSRLEHEDSSSVPNEVRLEHELAARSLRKAELAPNAAWDQTVNVSLGVRARVELLETQGLGISTQERNAVLVAALEGSRSVLEREAQEPPARRLIGVTPYRGWGTSKPIRIGRVSAESAVDAYSTGTVLRSLAELSRHLCAIDELSSCRSLFEALSGVLDHWVTERRFSFASGIESWEKIATGNPEIRDYVVFNTDALLAHAALILRGVAQTLGDASRAKIYEGVATQMAEQLANQVLNTVVDASGTAHAERWRYGLVRMPDGQLKPDRQEDTNHASFVLDFLTSAHEAGLAMGEGKERAPPRRLEALCRLVSEAGFVRGKDGRPALALYVSASDLTVSARGKARAYAFGLFPSQVDDQAVVSWWRELAGEARSLDLGLSIRTAWGWNACARRDAALLQALGEYLEAEAKRAGDGADNLFLARATWLRAKRARR